MLPIFLLEWVISLQNRKYHPQQRHQHFSVTSFDVLIHKMQLIFFFMHIHTIFPLSGK